MLVAVVITVPEQLIAPVIPSSTRHRHHATTGRPARPLPLADPPIVAAAPVDVVYGMSRLDPSGRITDYALIASLGWQPGDRFTITAHTLLIELQRDDVGVFAVTGRGHLPLPAAVRRRLGLYPGDRVLLSATPAAGNLAVCPMATLHLAVRGLRIGGEPA